MIFGSFDDSIVKYTGESVPELDIQTGDPLNTVLSKLLTSVKQATGITQPMAKDVQTDVSSAQLGGESLATMQIKERTFDYEVARKGDGANIIFDISNIENALPEGYEVLSAVAAFTDNTGRRSQVRGTAGQKEVANFPVRGEFILGIRTQTGDVEMRKSVFVPTNADDRQKATFDVRDFTSSTSTGQRTVEEVLNTLVAEQVEIKRKLETLVGLNLPVEIQSLKLKTSQINENPS